MPRWTKICCAVDPPDASHAALREAAELARTLGAELTLLHVVSLAKATVAATTALPGTADEVLDTLVSAAERELQPWKAEAEALSGRPVRLVVVPGVPPDEIVRFARDGGFDLIVVATHGRTGVRRLVLGSVAERVVREATLPVLVARPPAAPSPSDLGAPR